MTSIEVYGLGGVREDLGSLGNVFDDVTKVIKELGDVINDPLFPGIIKKIKTVREMAAGGPATTTASKLAAVDKGLTYYLFYKRNPWILPMAVFGVFAVPLFIGYLLGKRRKG